MRKTIASVFLGTLLALGPAIASAGMITFDFEAEGPDSRSVVGSFGYDTDTPDANAGPADGLYPNSGFFTGAFTGGTFDGATLSLSGLDWQVTNGIQDALFVLSPININLTDSSGVVFSSDDLPSVLNLTDFDERDLVVAELQVGDVFYRITSLAKVEVPEPSTLSLLILGLIGIGYARKKRAG